MKTFIPPQFPFSQTLLEWQIVTGLKCIFPAKPLLSFLVIQEKPWGERSSNDTKYSSYSISWKSVYYAEMYLPKSLCVEDKTGKLIKKYGIVNKKDVRRENGRGEGEEGKEKEESV